MTHVILGGIDDQSGSGKDIHWFKRSVSFPFLVLKELYHYWTFLFLSVGRILVFDVILETHLLHSGVC